MSSDDHAAARRVIACGCGEPYPCGHIDPATIPPSDAALTTQVFIRQPLVCGSCGGTFYDHHECPTIPSQTMPTQRVFIHIPTITVQP